MSERTMRLDELLVLASEVEQLCERRDVDLSAARHDLAAAIIALLKTDSSSGFYPPRLIDGEIWAGEINFGSPDEARAFAVELLRAADDAEGRL